jgi:C-terminal processing protease CtpA/Prc
VHRQSPAYLDSRAGKAGMKVGDELLSLNGEPLTASNTMTLFKKLNSTGGALQLVVRRSCGAAGAAGTAHALHQEAMLKAKQWRMSSNAQGTAL